MRFIREEFKSEHIKLHRHALIMISKNIQDWLIVHFNSDKSENFLKQSNQGTLLEIRTSA